MDLTPGYREVATALYLDGDDHIDSDTVFGVNDSLVIDTRNRDQASPFPDLPSVHLDFKLGADKDGLSGRVGADPAQLVKA